MRRVFLTVAIGLLGSAFALGDEADDQKLIEQAAANRPQPQKSPQNGAATAARPDAATAEAAERTAPVAADESLADEERSARAGLALAQARVELIAARKLLRADRSADAAKKANRVLALLRKLPSDVDASEFELQAEGILAKARRAAGKQSAALGDRDNDDTLKAESKLDARSREAARLGKHFDGSDTPDVDTRGDAAALRERARNNQNPDKSGYHPGKEIIDERAVHTRSKERVRYEGALHEAVAEDEAARLTAAEESRLAGEADVTYPDDWRDRVARRERWKDGMIARGPAVVGPDGKEWFLGVYDLRDIAYEPPDFSLPFGIHPAEEWRNQLDREALRWRSQIFNGYADDLAGGIPLLRFFGGTDDFESRGPKYNPAIERMVERLVRMITDQRPTEPAVEASPSP
ncbi:MAG: hypothetical protein JNG88_09085 [Phycisphaerales bacterium]|nr:hypothetical protein [Phycisphaerales bacterium]